MKYLFFFLFLVFLLLLVSSKFVQIRHIVAFSKDEFVLLKGIAIMLVLISHIGGLSGTKIVTPLGGIGVSIFLFLSGYGLSKSREKNNNLEGYWVKKIKTVVVPYCIIQSIAFLLHLINYNSFFNFIKDISFLNPLHPNGWYLNCLLIYYSIFYICFKCSRKTNYGYFYLASFIIGIVLLVFKQEIYFEQILSFPWGVYIAEKGYDKYLNLKFPVIFIIVGIISLILKQTSFIREGNYIIYYYLQLMIKLPIGFSIVILVTNIMKKVEKLMGGLYFLGEHSYILYLIHAYVMAILNEHMTIGYSYIIVFIVLLLFILLLLELFAKKIIIKK